MLNKRIWVPAIFAALILSGCIGSSDEKSDGPSPVGIWENTDFNVQYNIKADNTYEEIGWDGFQGYLYYKEVGTWSTSGNNITFTATSCIQTPLGGDIPETTTCEPPFTVPYSVDGNVFSINIPGVESITHTKVATARSPGYNIIGEWAYADSEGQETVLFDSQGGYSISAVISDPAGDFSVYILGTYTHNETQITMTPVECSIDGVSIQCEPAETHTYTITPTSMTVTNGTDGSVTTYTKI